MKFFNKFVTRTLLLFLCFWGALTTLQAQRVVTGEIKDAETGEALIGATVIEKENRANGTQADIDGKYSIKIGRNATALIVSYTGFETQEIALGTSNVLNVGLLTSAAIKEVVVIGYGTVKREDATGLVQSVSSGSFNKGAITGAQELLAGKVSGVVITTDPSPGGGAKIRIRGESSLKASNDPLIVVDGVPLDDGGVSGSRNPLNLINPSDIETMTVLKDASATAIYGSRASAGVILITTKKGKLGKKINIGYGANFSAAETANRVDMLTADEFRQVITTRSQTGTPPLTPVDAVNLLGNANTNWQDEIYQTAKGQDHNLSVSGGVGIVPYRVSLGYTDKNGLLKTDKFKRYSTAVNLTPGFLNNTLQVNVHFKGMWSKNHFADRGAIGNALRFDPTKPVRDTSTRYGGYTAWLDPQGIPQLLGPTNPVALLELKDDNSNVNQYIANTSVDYRLPFLPAMRVNLSVGYDHSHGEGTIVAPDYATFAYQNRGVNNTYESTRENKVLESYANYKKGFGGHDIDLMAGYSWQHFTDRSNYRNSNTDGSRIEEPVGPSFNELYIVSVYGRANYAYKNRLLLTGTLRRDASSRFDPRFRVGVFPSAALAVKLVENKRNFLKLRTSWGITGQQNIGDRYAFWARYKVGDNRSQYQFGDQYYSTLRADPYVANIKWEQTTTYNAGLDFGIIGQRVTGTFDVYQRNTSDLLNFIPVPALSNLSNFVTTNIGTMRTRGVELGLNITPIKNKLINWDISTNFAYNKSEITKLTTSTDPNYPGVPLGGIAGGVGTLIQIHSVGYSPSSFFVKKQLYTEDGQLLENKFADLNGDSLFNNEDRYRYKNPSPTYTIGFSSNLNIGDFDFSFATRANLGQYVYNNVQSDLGYFLGLYNSSGYIANIHQSAVDLNVEKQASLTLSDHFVVKADFFRIDHITAGYNFQKLVKHNLRVYVTVQNPLVVTPYKGLDPEIGDGIDNNIYPRPRTFLAGFNINF